MAASMSMLLSCHNFRQLTVQFNHVAKLSRFSRLLSNAPPQTGKSLSTLSLSLNYQH